MQLLLDSSFVIDFLRGLPDAQARLAAIYKRGDEPLVTSIVVAEVWSGAEESAHQSIDRFFRFIEYVHPGPQSARRAGEWRRAARRDGRTLGLADAMIAATAHDCAAAVLTRNVRDFGLTPVRVETY